MQTSLHEIANAAIKDKTKRFCSLYSLFNRVLLEQAYHKLNKDAATGIDEVTWEDYGRNLPRNLIELEESIRNKTANKKKNKKCADKKLIHVTIKKFDRKIH